MIPGVAGTMIDHRINFLLTLNRESLLHCGQSSNKYHVPSLRASRDGGVDNELVHHQDRDLTLGWSSKGRIKWSSEFGDKKLMSPTSMERIRCASIGARNPYRRGMLGSSSANGGCLLRHRGYDSIHLR